MQVSTRGGIGVAVFGLVVTMAAVLGLVRYCEEDVTTQRGLASWYGPGFHGKKTASGETFNQRAMTAAHRELPLGTRVMVTNLENGRTVEVEITDRGPYVDDRIIDLSKAAAKKIGIVKFGTAPVRIDVVGDEVAGK